MGRILEAWAQTELPKLLLTPPSNMGEAGIPQPGGGRTFPMREQGPVDVFTPSGSPMLPPNWRSQIPRSPAAQRFATQSAARAPQPTFAAPPPYDPGSEQMALPPGSTEPVPTFQQPQAAAPAMQPEGPPAPGDDENSFSGMVKKHPGIFRRGLDVLMNTLGGDAGLDAAYAKATGSNPNGLSRAQKGQLLMEFGLRTLANNDGLHTGLEAIGKAGAETIGSARQQIESNRRGNIAEQESEDRRLTREAQQRYYDAQVEKAKSDSFQLKTDSQGRLVRINVTDGTSQIVLDNEGKPVIANSSEGREFESEVSRQAYVTAYCEGLDGAARKRCEQRALAFSKGGATDFALPEQLRVKVALQVREEYNKDDARRARRRLPNGVEKPWSEMTNDEQETAMNFAVDRFMKSYADQVDSRLSAPPASDNNFGLTPDQISGIGEGKAARLSNGVIVAKRNGKLIRIDENGNPL